MENALSATILNAGASVTPLNFRHWLREELKRQCFSGLKDGNVAAFIFATRQFITVLGGKQFNKIIASGVKKHPWIVDVQIIMTIAPVSDEDAKAFVEAQGDDDFVERDYGSLLLGYKTAQPDGLQPHELNEEPSCVVRLISEGDIEKLGKDNYGYKVGDYAVVGGGVEFVYSRPFSTQEAAREFAAETYQTVHFIETKGII